MNYFCGNCGHRNGQKPSIGCDDMNIGLYTLTSPLHDQEAVEAASAGFIREIESELNCRFDIEGADFGSYGTHDLEVIYVRTGGTEGLFKEVFPLIRGNILLLTSGRSNSLAASMEIMSYLHQQGRRGEILHGSIAYISGRLRTLVRVVSAAGKLYGSNVGVIGQPSDWLISSDADRRKLMEKLGINLIDIPIAELVAEIAAIEATGDSTVCPDIASDVVRDFNANAPDRLKERQEMSLRIYLALRMIIDRYSLNGLTVRCFDLLDAVHNTGCLALAILNAEGIPSGCEGDVPALVTMMIGQALTGQCGFQANPSRIDPERGELVFAHCTVPLDMVCRYSFDSHFESGLGIAIKGEMPKGPATLVKVSGDVSRMFCKEALLTENLCESSLCRTQICLKLDEEDSRICRDYFLSDPIGNHHIVFCGKHRQIFEDFFGSISAE